MLDCGRVEMPRKGGTPLEANGAYLTVDEDLRERVMAVHCLQKSPEKFMTLPQSLAEQMRTPGMQLVDSDAVDIWGSFFHRSDTPSLS